MSKAAGKQIFPARRLHNNFRLSLNGYDMKARNSFGLMAQF
jgi:hypothetical protein